MMLRSTSEMATDVPIHSDPTDPCLYHLAVQPGPIPRSGTGPTCSFLALLHLEGRSAAPVALRDGLLGSSRAI